MTMTSLNRLGQSLLACLVLAAMPCRTAAQESHELRGYGSFTMHSSAENALTVHRLRFADAERARRFASKLYGDFLLTSGNRLQVWTTPHGEIDAIALADRGYLLPLLTADAESITVMIGDDRQALIAAAMAQAKPPLMRRAQLDHPLFMDKWDRHCLGIWGRIGDPEQVYPEFADDRFEAHDTYYKWAGRLGINPQLNVGKRAIDLARCDNQTSWQRQYLSANGVNYQRVEWLMHHPDLYNRNPFLTHTINPHVATEWSYYGERSMAGSLLRQVQNANALVTLVPTLADPNQMAILDPNGEIGPFAHDRVGLYGPVARREFVRFLREIRKLSLGQVSSRYYGREDSLKSWDDVTLADWREFYGWSDGSTDLAGEWRFMRDDDLQGFRLGWALPDFNDDDWIRLYYPGDAMLHALPANDKPIWMRKSFTVNDLTRPTFLSIAPLTAAAVQLFLNGRPLEPLEPNFHTARTYGQFDITEQVRANQTVTVAIRLTEAPAGPIFLTHRPIETFPTSDPRVNARRWDHLEFVDWVVAQAVGTTLEAIRAVEPDRPIKVHAYGSSPWGWKTVADYGGYSHHTGSGAGWVYTVPKRYGAARGLQHSSEPGGPMKSLRDFKGIWGALAAMGMNAHDYFISPQSITDDPDKRAYFERNVDKIKVMGRANLVVSPVAAIRGTLNTEYQGEFAVWENWRYGVDPTRGGELVPLLDEVRLREGNLEAFRAIVDEGTACWDEEMTAALRAYVEQGGVLILNRLSGLHTFIQRDAGPGAALAGVQIAAPPATGGIIAFAKADDWIPGIQGDMKVWERKGLSGASLQPMPGTEIIGRWPDGSAAFTRRALGSGMVYFASTSAYPAEIDSAVAAAFGPRTFATADGGADLVRTARANNGSEELLMLRGLGKPLTVTWTCEQAPTAGIYDAVTGEPIHASIEGNTATFSIDIPDWDFRWLAARRPDPARAFSHWLERQAQIWAGVTHGADVPIVPLFRNLGLNQGWKLVQTDSIEDALALLPLDDDSAGMAPTQLLFWNAPGMTTRHDDGVIGLYRRTFDLPEAWRRGNRFDLAVSGRFHDSRLHGFIGPGTIYLNGKEIWAGERLESAWLDVTNLLKPLGNRLEIVHPSPGIVPVVRLVRSALPESVINLAGEWQAVSRLHAQAPVHLPGRIAAGFVYRDIVVPPSAADREVWLRVEGNCASAVINGRMRYRALNLPNDIGRPPFYEIDITPDIRFGQPNRILLGNGWRPGEIDYARIELALYRPGQWASDGQGTRQALTEKELAAVARDAALIQQYPMVHAPMEKAAPAALPTDALPPELPPAIVDLRLDAEPDHVIDRGPHQLAVTLKGTVEPFSEAGGRIRGVYLRGESAAPATIELPPAVFRRHLEGKASTIRVWVKPMAIDRAGGSLFNWSSYLFDWKLADHSTSILMPSAPQKKLTVNALIRQREWQSLTLVLDGPAATLYWNGVPVGMQIWEQPPRGTDVPLTIGSIGASREFLNAKLAAFTIYEGALAENAVALLYAAERSRYRVEPADYPEDDLFRLDLSAGVGADAAEISGRVEQGEGVTLGHEQNRPFLSLDGRRSYLVLAHHPRAALLHRPFTLVLDFRPAPGASGTIFRRHHALALQLLQDGTLRFDANIGRRNWIDFPKAVTFGEWNRLRFSYDGRTARLEVDDGQPVEQDYPGALATGSSYPLVFFADNTYPGFPAAFNIACDVRELRLMLQH